MCVLVGCLAVAGSAEAMDVYGEDVWFRGDANSTMQHWTFTTDQQTDIVPEDYSNPYLPAPECDIVADNAEWRLDWEAPAELLDEPTDPGIPGWHMPAGGTTIYLLHNDPTPRAMKILIQQMTCSKEPLSVSLELPAGHTYEAIDPVSLGMPTVVWGQPAPFSETGADWATYVYAFEIYDNPEWESIVVEHPPCTTLDQIMIDTVCCAPEPATLSLLALGGVALIRRRRAA